jgi:hypothetical protein
MSIPGGLGSMGYDFFQRATRVLKTKQIELLEYADEEGKKLFEFDIEKCDMGWSLFPDSTDVSQLTFACR